MTALSHSPENGFLVLKRVFAASAGRVYDAWTRKEQLDQWCAPKDFTIVESGGDLRPGGAWRSCMRAPWGAMFCVGGVYRELVEAERLSFTHAWEEGKGHGHETLVTVRFIDHDGRTEMIFEQSVFETIESRDSHAAGWSECFHRLAEFLSGDQGDASPV